MGEKIDSLFLQVLTLLEVTSQFLSIPDIPQPISQN